MKLEKEVKREIYKIAIGSAWCTALVVVAFVVLQSFGYAVFDYTVAIGAAVGYLLSVGNFFFMSVGIVNAFETGDEALAKTKLRSSYITRTVLILAVVAASILLKEWINPIPVLLSVFYANITIKVCNFWNTFVLKKNNDVPTVTTPVEEPEEEENTDEFDKFVSRFAKGPIPGEENKENENKAE